MSCKNETSDKREPSASKNGDFGDASGDGDFGIFPFWGSMSNVGVKG